MEREDDERRQYKTRAEGCAGARGGRKETAAVRFLRCSSSPAERGSGRRRRRSMEVLSNKIDREQLKPGDHIYSWRKGYIYAHHGIYVGDGNVVHFTRGGEEIGTGTVFDRLLSSSVPSCPDSPCEQCGDQSALNGVIKSCLNCFLSGGNLYIFHYSVSPVFFIAKVRGGTCTFAPSDPAAEVLHRARQLLQHGFGAYDLFKNNCEDFAIYCKTGLLVTTSYGVGRSGQWGCIVSAVSAIASSPLRFLSSSFGGLAVVTSGIYCLNRVVSDIGIRRDVVKLPVEKLVWSSAATGEADSLVRRIVA